MRYPHIVILASALSFIKEEVNKADPYQETGGLLLGVKLPHGRLITHATPPGPKALHRSGMFERDLEFSQAALNYFVIKTGVDYIGEWHKHPPGMTQPSWEDRKGVIEILRDPDYKTGGILIFPIWTRVQENEPSHVPFHQALAEYCFRRTRGDFRCFPYYMDKTLEFRSFEFQIAKCNLGTDREMEKFYKQYLLNKGIKEKTVFRNFGRDNKTVVTDLSNSDANIQKVIHSKSKPPIELLNKKCKKKINTIGYQYNGPEQQTLKPKVQWYKTNNGKRRLVAERNSFKDTNCFIGARVLTDERLVCRFISPRYEDVFLDVICNKNHPLSFPEILLGHKEDYKNVSNLKKQQFDTSASLKIFQRLEKLKTDWENDDSFMIGHIANVLGFSRLLK